MEDFVEYVLMNICEYGCDWMCSEKGRSGVKTYEELGFGVKQVDCCNENFHT